MIEWIKRRLCTHVDLVPLYGITMEGMWANEVVGWGCMRCYRQFFFRDWQSAEYTDAGYGRAI